MSAPWHRSKQYPHVLSPLPLLVCRHRSPFHFPQLPTRAASDHATPFFHVFSRFIKLRYLSSSKIVSFQYLLPFVCLHPHSLFLVPPSLLFSSLPLNLPPIHYHPFPPSPASTEQSLYLFVFRTHGALVLCFPFLSTLIPFPQPLYHPPQWSLVPSLRTPPF